VTGAAAVTETVTVTEAVAVTAGPGAARARTESEMGQAPEDGEDGIEKGQGGRDSGLVHVTPGHGNGQMGANFPGRAGGDSVVMKSILARTSGAFSDVTWHRGAGAFELQGQIPVVQANALDRWPERADHLQSHLVDLEAFHQDLLCRGLKQAAVRV
jgi:hypothetical protein